MATEITLTGTFLLSLIILKITKKKYQFALAGRIAMAAMLVLTGIAHFVFTKGMAMMIPGFIPYKTELVYITGALELAAAAGLLLPRFSLITGRCLVLFFIFLLIANIYGSAKQVNLEKGTYDGSGLHYLWYRIPLQFFFIGWVYFSSIKPRIKKQAVSS